ncbi:MAG: sulfate transporter family protein [Pseudomonadota bacterium]
MIADLARAFGQLGSPAYRVAFAKTLALTLGILAILWLGLTRGLDAWVEVAYADGWIDWLIDLVAGLGLFVGLIFLVPIASALVAGLFLDEMAEVVEREHYPGDQPGRALPLWKSVPLSLRFMLVVLIGNLVALALLLVPVVNVVAFLLVNAYLLGREFFDLAALRFHPKREVDALRARHRGRIYLAGLAIAGFVAIPILNLLTPLFATALMVHVHKRLSRPSVSAGAP